MGSTTVHIPDDLLKRVDEVARRRGVSRNRVVVTSLEAEIARDRGEWPEEFFAALTEDDYEDLADATREIEEVVLSRRQSRGAVFL